MIDYAKYENMSKKQLTNALISVEKKEQKIRQESQAKLKDVQELAFFLKSKIKESTDNQKSVPYIESKSYKIARQREMLRTKKEQESLAKEVENLVYKDYADEL